MTEEKIKEDKVNNMEFIQINEEQRTMLLNFLDIKERKCQFCDEIEKNCAIMPPINTEQKATILCDSPLCMSEYFTLLETDNKTEESLDEKIFIVREEVRKLETNPLRAIVIPEKRIELDKALEEKITKEVFDFIETNYVECYREENIVKNTINEFWKVIHQKLKSFSTEQESIGGRLPLEDLGCKTCNASEIEKDEKLKEEV